MIKATLIYKGLGIILAILIVFLVVAFSLPSSDENKLENDQETVILSNTSSNSAKMSKVSTKDPIPKTSRSTFQIPTINTPASSTIVQTTENIGINSDANTVDSNGNSNVQLNAVDTQTSSNAVPFTVDPVSHNELEIQISEAPIRNAEESIHEEPSDNAEIDSLAAEYNDGSAEVSEYTAVEDYLFTVTEEADVLDPLNTSFLEDISEFAMTEEQKECFVCNEDCNVSDFCRICPAGHEMHNTCLKRLHDHAKSLNLANARNIADNFEAAVRPTCPICRFPLIETPGQLFEIVSGLLGVKRITNAADINDPVYSYVLKPNISAAKKWEAIKGHIDYFRFTNDTGTGNWTELYEKVLITGNLANLNHLLTLNIVNLYRDFSDNECILPFLIDAIQACGTDPEYANLKGILQENLENLLSNDTSSAACISITERII